MNHSATIFLLAGLGVSAEVPKAIDVLDRIDARLTEELDAFDPVLTREFSLSDQTPSGTTDTSMSPEVTAMEPFVVTIDKLPQFQNPPEDPVQKFFRTGTLAQQVGRRVTTKLWMKGDKGVMMSFSW